VTRKDYQLLANTLKSVRDKAHIQPANFRIKLPNMKVWLDTCESISAALKIDNARFNPRAFLVACGYSIAELNVIPDNGDIGQYDSNGSA